MEKVKTVIRDRRSRRVFWLDNKFTDDCLIRMSSVAIIVYLVLCRHASLDERCHPGRERLCKLTGYSEGRVSKGLAELRRLNLIYLKRVRDPGDGRMLRNEYMLIDQSKWNVEPHLKT